jgi:hypothetical protein
MVDLDDKMKREFIYSTSMLHFIIEHFSCCLETAILRKRLFVSIIADEINALIRRNEFVRRDNGIYKGVSKLSVAVATKSPVSSLIHIGLNISSKDTPVNTACLKDHKIDPSKLALKCMKRYCDEMASVTMSKSKVRGVK